MRPESFAPRVRGGLVAAALLTAAALGAQAPSAVVERIVTLNGRTIRTTLFTNRVAVVSISESSERLVLRRQTLSEDEYEGYLFALEREADELADVRHRRDSGAIAVNGAITLSVGAGAPHTVRYSSVAILDLVTGRLVKTIDDIEARVLWGPTLDPGLATWKPRRGDRVELKSGTLATVREAREDGTLVLEHDGTGIHEIVPLAERGSVIRRILERQR